MARFTVSYEKLLLEKIRKDDASSFSVVFSYYYKDLVTFAFGLIHNLPASEEIVQDVFVKLWENRADLTIDKSLKSYLLKSVQNRGLNWMQHLKVRSQFDRYSRDHQLLSDNETENYILHSELERSLQNALDKIPAEFARAFRMNRFENLSYAEIADKLGVSVRTIEVRISRALGLLRESLKEFLILIALVIRMF